MKKTKKLCLIKELTIDSVKKSYYYNAPYTITVSITKNYFDSYDSIFTLRDSELQKLCSSEENPLSLLGKKLVVSLKQKNHRGWKSYINDNNRNHLKISKIECVTEGSPRSPYKTTRKVIFDSHAQERADYHPTVIDPPSYYLILPITQEEFNQLKTLPEYCFFELNYKSKQQ